MTEANGPVRTPSGSHAPGFPWVQLVFCLACLAMAAWTWMRYSYAWVINFRDIPDYRYRRGLITSTAPKDHPHLVDRYVRLVNMDEVACDGLTNYFMKYDSGRGILVCTPKQYAGGLFKLTQEDLLLSDVPFGPDSPLARCPTGVLLPVQLKEITGRFTVEYVKRYSLELMKLDLTASRFHPASIAGLVVGAMGCFIFGLYLRRWLVERKAFAREPEQDMIA